MFWKDGPVLQRGYVDAARFVGEQMELRSRSFAGRIGGGGMPTGAGDRNRTHIRSLGSLLQTHKNAQIGGNLTFFEILKWIPIGAVEEDLWSMGPAPKSARWIIRHSQELRLSLILQDCLECAPSGRVSKDIVSLHNVIHHKPVRHDLAWMELARAHELQQRRYRNAQSGFGTLAKMGIIIIVDLHSEHARNHL